MAFGERNTNGIYGQVTTRPRLTYSARSSGAPCTFADVDPELSLGEVGHEQDREDQGRRNFGHRRSRAGSHLRGGHRIRFSVRRGRRVRGSGDVYKATAVRDIGSTYTQVVALSLPAGTYTLTGSAHLIYADQARCRVTAGPNMTTPRGSGYNEASLSATGTVTLASAGKVQLLCSSEKILPVPQNAGANGTLVATRVGLLDDQGTVAP